MLSRKGIISYYCLTVSSLWICSLFTLVSSNLILAILQISRTENTGIDISGTSIKKILHNDFYVGYLLTDGRVNLWHKNNLTHFVNLQKGTFPLGSILQNIVDCDLVQNDHMIALLTSKAIVQVTLTSNTIFNQANLPTAGHTGYTLTVNKQTIFILASNSSNNNLIRYERANLSNFKSWNVFSGGLASTSGLALCQQQNNSATPTNQYIMTWYYSPVFQLAVFYCQVNPYSIATCGGVGSNPVLPAGSGWKMKDIFFDDNCQKMIYETDNQGNTNILDLTNSGSVARSYDFSAYTPLGNDGIYYTQFLDYQEKYMAFITDNNSILMYNSQTGSTNQFIQEKSFSKSLQFINYDIERQTFFQIDDTSISTFQYVCPNLTYYVSLVQCAPCQQNCTDCDRITGVCNSYYVYVQHERQYVTNQEEFIILIIKDLIQYSRNPLQILNWTFLVFPLSALFIRFINFWSICSFYVFVYGITMPEYFKNVLISIFVNANASLLDKVGLQWVYSIYLPKDTKDNKLYTFQSDQLDISSDYSLLNGQNYILFLVSIIFIGTIVSLCKNCGKNAQQKMKQNSFFEFNSFTIIVGQFITIIPLFFICLRLIEKSSHNKIFNQKINLVIHIFSMFLGLIFTFLVISYKQKSTLIDRKVTKQQINNISDNTKQNIKITKKQRHLRYIKRLNWVYTILCNVIPPFTTIYGQFGLFVCLNGCLYVLGIYICLRDISQISKLRKFNNFILSLWLPLFHISFSALNWFTLNQSQFINHHLAMICCCIIVIGAFHQILNIVFLDIFWDKIVKLIKYLFKRQVKIDNKMQDQNNQIQTLSLKDITLRNKVNNAIKIIIKKVREKKDINNNKIKKASIIEDKREVEQKSKNQYRMKNEKEKSKKQVQHIPKVKFNFKKGKEQNKRNKNEWNQLMYYGFNNRQKMAQIIADYKKQNEEKLSPSPFQYEKQVQDSIIKEPTVVKYQQKHYNFNKMKKATPIRVYSKQKTNTKKQKRILDLKVDIVQNKY